MVEHSLSRAQDGGDRLNIALQSALTLDAVDRAFTDRGRTLISSDASGLYRADPDSGDLRLVSADTGPSFLDDYEAYGKRDDPVLDFVMQNRRAMDSSRLPGAEWRGSGACEALAVGGLGHALKAPVFVAGHLYGTVNFARHRDAPAFDDADLTTAQMAAEQLGFAASRAVHYETASYTATLLEATLDRIPQAVVVTDVDAQVLYRNRAARRQGMLRGSISETVVTAAWDALSSKEREIAELVAKGLSNKQVAERIFVSENTVKYHLKHIFQKIDVRGRVELAQIRWAKYPDTTINM